MGEFFNPRHLESHSIVQVKMLINGYGRAHHRVGRFLETRATYPELYNDVAILITQELAVRLDRERQMRQEIANYQAAAKATHDVLTDPAWLVTTPEEQRAEIGRRTRLGGYKEIDMGVLGVWK